MGQITWTSEAERWLRDIFEYIAADNPDAAARVVEGIYARAQVLARHPQIGQRYHASRSNVRILLYSHYRIAYVVKANGDVTVLGVFHGSLDIDRYQL